jgi:hypothetical protein
MFLDSPPVGPACYTVCMRKRNRRHTPPEPRFWRFVQKGGADDCWIWTGGTNGKYGVFGVDCRRTSVVRMYAHRFSYELHNGPIPDGFDVHHQCDNPLCVNPHHLVALSRKAHTRTKSGQVAKRAHQTVCHRGHPLEMYADGHRRCRICARQGALAAKERARTIAETDPSRIPHGTIAGYNNYGCRCDSCKAAERERAKAKRQREKNKAAEGVS